MKNKINNIVKSFAVAALGMLSLSSCNDFLTIYPTDKTIGENFWQNKDDVTQVVTGAYTAMINGGIIERMIMWGDFRSDELKKHPSLKTPHWMIFPKEIYTQVAVTTHGHVSIMSSIPVTSYWLMPQR